MTHSINATTTIADLQIAFSQEFPYLKVEFYTHPHEAGESTLPKYRIFNRQESFSKLESFTTDTTPFEFDETTTVDAFEQSFQKKYGVFVQVFQKSRGTWLPTLTPDNLTLAEQNKQGQEATRVPKEMDYAKETKDSTSAKGVKGTVGSFVLPQPELTRVTKRHRANREYF
jgi:hypothetical protein